MAKIKLTPRQWELVEYYNRQNDYVNDIDVCRDLKNHYPFDENTKNFNNTAARRHLTEDKKAIRLSDLPLLLISSNKGSKFATQEEWNNYQKKLDKKIKREQQVLSTLKKKAKRHGQLKMLQNKLKRNKAFIEVKV